MTDMASCAMSATREASQLRFVIIGSIFLRSEVRRKAASQVPGDELRK